MTQHAKPNATASTTHHDGGPGHTGGIAASSVYKGPSYHVTASPRHDGTVSMSPVRPARHEIRNYTI
jgi:hypothetical protein